MTLTANSLLNTYCLVIHTKYFILLTEKLNEKHGDRMRFYLSKADTAGQESDRQVSQGPSCSAVSCYPVHKSLSNAHRLATSSQGQCIVLEEWFLA